MNDTDLQELRDFLARDVMGWERGASGYNWVWFKGTHYDRGDYMVESRVNINDYRPDSPDSPASQLLGVIEAMREKGWEIRILTYEGETQVKVWFSKGRKCSEVQWADTLPLAVCLAARAALEEK